ncbi:glycosyltransferase family 2 protein [Marivibrio halodurans]|uniref:Glycosyltransferase family 2 protein n=1 Tax=Marivibrio halodurans TaxID=2039722 RepID=A0A8J7S2S1_9PROT|nr:glycosyltransferase family A protein [Marivibrio halodurans]MBP5855639.1 glycosyltransferase family 2 protein [Marivibrio halodurans]
MQGLSVGVVIPHRNHTDLLPHALKRLFADRSAAPDAVVIVDDYSDPAARLRVREIVSTYPSVKLIELSEHLGVVGALNMGIQAVETDLVHCSAADDTVEAGFLDAARAGLQAHPSAAIYSTRTRLISDADGQDLGVIASPSPYNQDGWVSPENARRTLMARDSWIFGNSSVYRRDRLVQLGGFDLALGSFCDGYIQRYMAARWGAIFDERPFGAWRRSDTGVASRTNLDPDLLVRTAAAAFERFQANTPDIFPSGYAQRWRRRWISGALCFQIDRGKWSGFDHPGVLDVVPSCPIRFARLCRSLGSLGRPLAKGLVFAGLRPFDAGDLVARRLRLQG